MVDGMIYRQLLRRFLPVLVMAGLILSPFAASTAANAMGGNALVAMVDDMSNCPSKQSGAPDCQQASCSLMTVCAANWIAGAPTLAFGASADAIRPGSDTFGAPLAEGPPARPPRT